MEVTDASDSWSAEEDPNTEDELFLNDGLVEYGPDSAGIDLTNIVRCKRRRRAPARWVHPDAEQIDRAFCRDNNIQYEDLLRPDDSPTSPEDTASSDTDYQPEGEDEDEDEPEDEDEDEIPLATVAVNLKCPTPPTQLGPAIVATTSPPPATV